MLHTQVLIIGGGPAGSACAIRLRQQNIDCIVADKAVFPRVKLCGGLMTLKTKQALKLLLGEECYTKLLDEAVVSTVGGFSLYKKAEKVVTCNPKEPMVLLDRPKMDHFLFRKAAEKGCLTIEGDGIKAVDFEGKVATLQSGHQIGYDYLVAADGAGSVVKKQLQKHDARFAAKKPCGAVVELEVRAEDIDIDDSIGIYFGIVPRSYAWAFPKGSTVSVGLGKTADAHFDMKAELRKFMQMLGVRNIDSYDIRGCLIPFHCLMKHFVWHDEVLFAGDAAGLVEPLTSEGICFAVDSGRMAAEAIAGAVAGNGPLTDTYEGALTFARSFIKHGAMVEKALNFKPLMNMMLRRAPGHVGFMNFFYDEFIDKGADGSFLEIRKRWKAVKSKQL